MCVLRNNTDDIIYHDHNSTHENNRSRTACICQDGKLVEPNTICPKNAKSMQYTTHQNNGNQNGIYYIIIIVMLVSIIVILLGVQFYQKYRFRSSVLNSNRYVPNFDSFKNQSLNVIRNNMIQFQDWLPRNIVPANRRSRARSRGFKQRTPWTTRVYESYS